jgi:hypothetical protein
MPLPALRAGVGLLLALAMIIGWSLGIGLPLATVIIWLFSQPALRARSRAGVGPSPMGIGTLVGVRM